MPEDIVKKKFRIASHAVIVDGGGKLLMVKLPHDTSYYS